MDRTREAVALVATRRVGVDVNFLSRVSRRDAATRPAGAPRDPGPHHKPFGSARTARGLRALDLVGALHALWRAERRGAREKGFDQDRRTIHDTPDQGIQSRKRGPESIRVLRNVSCVAREGTCPTGTEYCRRRFDGGLRNAILAFQPPGTRRNPRNYGCCLPPLLNEMSDDAASIRVAVEELLSTAGYERAAADPDEPSACGAYDSSSLSAAEAGAVAELRELLKAEVASWPAAAAREGHAHMDDFTLLRFVQARPAGTSAAAAMFRESMAWRSSDGRGVGRLFAAHHARAPPTPTNEAGRAHFYGGFAGFGLSGEPLLVERLGCVDLAGIAYATQARTPD